MDYCFGGHMPDPEMEVAGLGMGRDQKRSISFDVRSLFAFTFSTVFLLLSLFVVENAGRSFYSVVRFTLITLLHNL